MSKYTDITVDYNYMILHGLGGGRIFELSFLLFGLAFFNPAAARRCVRYVSRVGPYVTVVISSSIGGGGQPPGTGTG